VKPCFFIGGPTEAVLADGDLATTVNGTAMVELRETIRQGGRRECTSCVCSIWRDFQQGDTLLPPPRPEAASVSRV
jgi:hypothetical protein